MRVGLVIGALLLSALACESPAFAQAAAEQTPQIAWEVKSRFRLFRNERDFERQLAAQRGDGVLAAEERLARASDGRGWARELLGQLCLDAGGSACKCGRSSAGRAAARAACQGKGTRSCGRG